MCDNTSVYGDWRISEHETELHLLNIKHLLTEDKLQRVCFNDIGWKGKGIDFPLDENRYNRCDVSYPCIITIGKNPYNCKYRMIDGRHRMYKMKELGINESIFYVLELEIFNKYLKKPKVSILDKLKKWCSKEEFKW